MKIYVSLEPHEVDRLIEIAAVERRRPQDQAALMLLRALDEATPTLRTVGERDPVLT